MQISKAATNKEIKALFKAIKTKKRSVGEKYTAQHFVKDLHLTDENIYYKWVSDPQARVPSAQSIALMNHLANREGV